MEATSRVSELELRTTQLEEELKQARTDLQGSLRENQVSEWRFGLTYLIGSYGKRVGVESCV